MCTYRRLICFLWPRIGIVAHARGAKLPLYCSSQLGLGERLPGVSHENAFIVGARIGHSVLNIKTIVPCRSNDYHSQIVEEASQIMGHGPN
ncbi:unnamed protein product [Phytomonas sp. EM1]|nr:unnamed protein product [Phytomonas sp. EM1]|eukprot:CCW60525.1 unnamed protein product [Phytomonas sp. isolate EM1]